jgi:capsular polysaccharide biosynthesis protein
MFQKARETAYQDSESLLMLVIQWRKPLIISVLIGAILSFIFSGPLFITPKFKSSVIFFPTATNSISRAILDHNSSDKQDILAFGAEEQAEQMLQILNSDEISDQITRKYDLMNHYEIPADAAYPKTKLNEILHDNILFSRTEFMSVRIDVYDKNPQMAADIANDIASLLDSLKSKIQRTRAVEALTIMKRAVASKKAVIFQLEDSLQNIREKGVMDFRTQSQIVNNEYMAAIAVQANEQAALQVIEKYKADDDSMVVNTKARISGATARIKQLGFQLDNLTRFGGASMSLNDQLSAEREELSQMQQQYDKLEMDANENLSHKFLVNKAIKAERKTYPVRWLIVLVSTMITFILSLVVILSIVRYKELKYNL